MIRPALVQRLKDSEPLDEINHGSKPAGSRAALTSFSCHRCGEEGHTAHHTQEMADLHLDEIGADFDLGDVPYLCERCAEKFNYTDVGELDEGDLSEEEIELHGQQLRVLNR